MKSKKGNDPQVVFQQCIEKALETTVKASSIHPVYDYVDDTLGEQFIFFIEAANITPATFPASIKAEWFSLAKISKIHMSEDTRHDILIGERVIRSLEA